MTNQEAVRLIRNLPTMCKFTNAYGEPIDSDAYYEAVDMAISALQEQEAKLNTISRTAAIEVLSLDKEMLSRVLDDMDVVGTDREKYSWGLGLIESNIKDIEELPPAQPDIVRCKDCVFHGFCKTSTARVEAPKDDWYCGDAERRTDEQT